MRVLLTQGMGSMESAKREGEAIPFGTESQPASGCSIHSEADPRGSTSAAVFQGPARAGEMIIDRWARPVVEGLWQGLPPRNSPSLIYETRCAVVNLKLKHGFLPEGHVSPKQRPAPRRSSAESRLPRDPFRGEQKIQRIGLSPVR